jgi:ABC-type transport system involved in multi-copper enzyme maturation permease subunit
MIALVRTEFIKAAQRTRTLVVMALLVALPALITFAVNARKDRPGENRGEGLFRLATQSGLVVPAAVLGVMSGFLLVVIAGMLAADSVAGDAAWGNLRYLLMRPVPRGRLLIAKAFVAGVLIWACTFLVVIVGLVAGVIMTNQLHKWAHMPTVPRLVAVAQRSGVVLSKEHHSVHHSGGYDSNYCITWGHLDLLLNRFVTLRTNRRPC